MRQKNTYLKANNLKVVTFTSIFTETLISPQFWIHDTIQDLGPSLFSGKLLFKAQEEQWEGLHLELYPDHLICKNLDDAFCQLQACFLKKFTHYDPSMPNFRHGLRLQQGNQLGHFLADSADTFKKWFQMLRRFCIMDKFNRKYKIVGKLRQSDPIFGQCCYSCIRIQDAGYFVVRIIDKDLVTQQQKANLFRELSNLRRLSHTQIVYFIELFEDDQHVYEIFEHHQGIDMRQYLKDSQIYQVAEQSSVGLDEKILSDVMYGLLQALSHMHQKGVFHRDIKLDNLCIPEKRRLPFVMLTNFCFSECWATDDQVFKKCGTPGFVAPEIFKTRNYTPKVDIFSLGVVMYILVFGKLPFEGKDQEEILKSNEKCEVDYKLEKRLCKKISKSGIDFLKTLLQKEPQKRSTAAQALNHHWFIKMGSKNQRQLLNPTRGKSLSTIIENSVDITQSFYQANTNSKGVITTSNRRYDEDRVEKEFVNESLCDRLQDSTVEIQTLKLLMNQFQDYVSNKLVIQLQAELQQAKDRIQLLDVQVNKPEEVGEILRLKDQLIKANQEKIALKEMLLKATQQHKSNIQLNQFFEYFGIPSSVKMPIKLQMVIEHFIEIKKQLKYQQEQQSKIDELQKSNQSLMSSLKEANKQCEKKVIMITKQKDDLQNIVNNLHEYIAELQNQLDNQVIPQQITTQIVQQQQQFDVVIECSSLKQLIKDGWSYQQNKLDLRYQAQIFIVSESFELINKFVKHCQLAQQISDYNAYFSEINQTLLMFKVIRCTRQCIDYIDKNIEALDELWMMYSLLQGGIVNVLANKQDFNLWSKVTHIREVVGSQYSVVINEYNFTKLLQYQPVQYQLHERIQQFCLAAMPWFFSDSDTTVIAIQQDDIIRVQAPKCKVKRDRATIKLHYISDSFQLSDKLIINLQKPPEYEDIKIKKYQLNTGVLVKCKIMTLSGSIVKLCQIFNYFMSDPDAQQTYMVTDDYIIITIKIVEPKADATLLIDNEILRILLSYLSIFDICRSTRVSRRWRDLIEKHPKMFQHVDIERVPPNTSLFSILKIFSRDKDILSLKLPPEASQTDTSYLLMQLPQTIQTLTFNNINMEFTKIFTRRFGNIVTLTLKNTTKRKKPFDEIEMKSLLTLSSAQVINFVSTPFEDAFITIFGQFQQLSTLSLIDAPQLTNQSLYLIAKNCTKLRTLILGGSEQMYNTNVTKAGFLIKLPQLECLELYYISKIGDETMAQIAQQLPTLRTLKIQRNNFEKCATISDIAFKNLSSLNLTHLSIIYTRKLKDSAQNYIANFSNLIYICLKDCPLQTDLSIWNTKCPLLQEVDFSGDSWVSQQQMNALSLHPNIRILWVGHFEHGDEECDTKLQLYPPEGIFLEGLFKKETAFVKMHTLHLEHNCNLTYWLFARIRKLRPHLFIQ